MSRLRGLWLTNLQAPYREPLWRTLAADMDLEVLFLAEGHRERPWGYSSLRGYDSQALPSVEMPGGGHDDAAYLLRRPIPGLRHADVLVLGGWESPAYWQARLQAKLSRTPVVAFAEFAPGTSRFDQSSVPGRARTLFYRSAHSVWSAGRSATDIVRSWGVPAERIVTGFNSIGGSELRRDVLARREGLDAPGEGHRFVFVGRLIPRKNVASVIHAFAEMADPRDELTIVGAGPLLDDLRALAHSSPDVAERIRFTGELAREQLVEVLATSQSLVLNSFAETWGMVVNEALVCGLHVIVNSRIGAVASVAGMQGVFVCEEDLSESLRASRAAWTGPVPEPPILQRGPEYAAQTFQLAVDTALSRTRKESAR